MTIEFAHRTRPPWDALETAEDEAAREQAEADFDGGEIGDFFAHVPDDWAECVIAGAIENTGSARVALELLAQADDERLWRDFREARQNVIRESIEQGRDG